MAFRLFFFESNQLNLAVYFFVTTVVLYIGPEWFMPSLLQGNPPTVDAPCGKIIGTRSVTRYGRDIAAFRGRYNCDEMAMYKNTFLKCQFVFGFKFIFTIYFYLSEGIPYAKPPVGKLRFKRTEPLLEIDNDGRPFYATSFGRICFQPSGLYYPTYVGQEDCLTLNVFVPNINQVNNGNKSATSYI